MVVAEDDQRDPHEALDRRGHLGPAPPPVDPAEVAAAHDERVGPPHPAAPVFPGYMYARVRGTALLSPWVKTAW